MEVLITVLKRLLKGKGASLWVVSIVLVFFAATVVSAVAYFNYRTSIYRNAAHIGEQAVKLLYDYGTIEQLDYQMVGLKEITTEPVFNQLTIDNEARTLNTYLKFKKNAVTVNVFKSTESYIMYSLVTKEISPDRKFIFMFELNENGKISWVREVEAIDFVTTFE